MIKRKKPKKVLILGSGALQIGQAGEFDYSGSQAIKALREDKISTVLINPNIATIQTSDDLADEVYFLPVTSWFAQRVIEKEKPDAILLGFGGQTALNVGIELHESGFLKKHGVELLGTPVKSIIDTEDRRLFAGKVKEIGLKVPLSRTVETVEDAVKAANEIGFPVMLRIAYALGGLGSGIVTNEEELSDRARRAFAFTNQILVEESLYGWKEVEYEIVRDMFDNCITVCSMENLDPMGIHTGDSMIVAPVQTLSAGENFKLRSMGIRLIRHLGIIGECNIQYAFDPRSDDYRIIEVNARLSRSSALASKATGYPLALIATKLALGYALHEIPNNVTRETSACFEPALDYIALKMPRWDLQKFKQVSSILGSEMKSVGEVMALGRSFEEVLQKAIRMLDLGYEGYVCNDLHFDNVEKELQEPTDHRVLAIAQALREGLAVDTIHGLSKIDRWFIDKMKNILSVENRLSPYRIENIPSDLLREAKQKGFSDKQIGMLTNSAESDVRVKRKILGIIPSVKQIDTTAAEFPAVTNYLYMTYNGDEDDIGPGGGSQVIVLGSGTYRIGSSVEFDWCCVNAVKTLGSLKYKTVMINYNPETVSTDYDICDRLYFEELSHERVMDIYERENPGGVIVSVGGQIPNNLAMRLHRSGARILGTSPQHIDNAENRHKFSNILDKLGVDQPAWRELTNVAEAKAFAKKVGYPVLTRPSYVLSGAAMTVASTEAELEKYLERSSVVNREHPVVISKFISQAHEIELDGVAQNGELFCYAISEHVENAGIHSGDATLVFPAQRTYLETIRRIKKITKQISRELRITGPFNIQFIAKENDIKVIECNLRASRSFPFVSKILRINFIDIATRLIVGAETPQVRSSAFDLDYVGVKVPQFSFTRLKGSDPVLGVEMASTGEAACMGNDFDEAFLKSLAATGVNISPRSVLVSPGMMRNNKNFLNDMSLLSEMGVSVHAYGETAKCLKDNGIDCAAVRMDRGDDLPEIISLLEKKKIDLVMNVIDGAGEGGNDYLIRRKSVDMNVSLITNLEFAHRYIQALRRRFNIPFEIKSINDYSRPTA